MRQKTKNHQNQGPIDKKFDFFLESLSHIPRWVHLVQKTRAKNSHAWAPLRAQSVKIPITETAVDNLTADISNLVSRDCPLTFQRPRKVANIFQSTFLAF